MMRLKKQVIQQFFVLFLVFGKPHAQPDQYIGIQGVEFFFDFVYRGGVHAHNLRI
jgi:hypothetical protein